MRELALMDGDALASLLKCYSMDCIEANPMPYELMLVGETECDRELGAHYFAGRFATYEGACTEAALQGRPGYVWRKLYRVKPGVRPYSPAPIAASTKSEILNMQRALAAQEV